MNHSKKEGLDKGGGGGKNGISMEASTGPWL